MVRPQFDMAASGRRMRNIRRERKISVKQVMDYMGFESTQAVYKWEAGKCYPQADNLLALAKLYQVSPAELLVEEDNESSSTVWLQPVYLSRDRFGSQLFRLTVSHDTAVETVSACRQPKQITKFLIVPHTFNRRDQVEIQIQSSCL